MSFGELHWMLKWQLSAPAACLCYQAPSSHYAGRIGNRLGTRMHFDLVKMEPTDAYKLLVSTVVPRPIALVTTVDRAGRVNAAPFSFFKAVSSIPRYHHHLLLRGWEAGVFQRYP
jgi:hypothetical protein